MNYSFISWLYTHNINICFLSSNPSCRDVINCLNPINRSTLENCYATFQEADAYRVTNVKSPRRSYKRSSHWRRISGVNYHGGRRNRYRGNQSVAAHLAIHRKSHPSLISLLDQRGRKTWFHNVGDVSASRIDRPESIDFMAETNFNAWNRVKTSVAHYCPFLYSFNIAKRSMGSYFKDTSVLSKLMEFLQSISI